jgi:hypothetical protein
MSGEEIELLRSYFDLLEKYSTVLKGKDSSFITTVDILKSVFILLISSYIFPILFNRRSKISNFEKSYLSLLGKLTSHSMHVEKLRVKVSSSQNHLLNLLKKGEYDLTLEQRGYEAEVSLASFKESRDELASEAINVLQCLVEFNYLLVQEYSFFKNEPFFILWGRESTFKTWLNSTIIEMDRGLQVVKTSGVELDCVELESFISEMINFLNDEGDNFFLIWDRKLKICNFSTNRFSKTKIYYGNENWLERDDYQAILNLIVPKRENKNEMPDHSIGSLNEKRIFKVVDNLKDKLRNEIRNELKNELKKETEEELKNIRGSLKIVEGDVSSLDTKIEEVKKISSGS